MVLDPAVIDLIHVAHHAAGDPALWDDVAQRVAQELRAAAVALVDHDLTLARSEIRHSHGIATEFRSLYRTHFAAANVWLGARHNFSAGQCFTGAELVPNLELVRTGFYRHWLRPQRFHHCLIAVMAERPGGRSFLLSLRLLDRPPFDAQDKRRLDGLLPALRCAHELGGRLAAHRSRGEIMRDVLEALPEAIFVIDREGYPVFANSAAAGLLGKKDGLRLMGGGLAAASPPETREFTQLLQKVAGGSAERGATSHEMLLSRPSGAPPLFLRFVPVAHALVDDAGQSSAVALVFVRPLDHGAGVPRLCGYYRMTPAEARLAALILQGHSLLAAASELHITKNTARTHMKRIYVKTATHRQVDLVRLLASADLPPDEAEAMVTRQ